MNQEVSEPLGSLIETFAGSINKIKESSLVNNEYMVFMGSKFYNDMDFNNCNSSELILKHSMIHNIFSTRPEGKTKINLPKIHKRIILVMKNKGLKHDNYDKLDGLLDKV